MIGKLSGILDSTGEDRAMVDVGGVGYVVFASARTLGNLPSIGEPVTLYIETHVREDHIHLYGFADLGEQDLFRLLLSVQGVGARVALAIMAVLSPVAFRTAVASGDKGAITQASGVGPKLAARLINELKDKLTGDLAVDGSMVAALTGGDFSDAVSALVNLGYRPAQAHTAVAVAQNNLGQQAGVQQLIRVGLRELGQ
jgi:Holliday junction DNA helicase RuvA